MTVRKEYKTSFLRFLAIIALILAASVFQATPNVLPEIFGARAFLLIPLIVSVSMRQSMFAGAAAGIFAGALWDASSSMPDGYLALYLGALGFICAFLTSRYVRDTLKTALLFCMAGCLAFVLIRTLCYSYYFNFDGAGILLKSFYLPSFIYTCAFLPLIYMLTKKIPQNQ